MCNDAHIHGRTGWKAKPFTRADLLSNLVSIALCCKLFQVVSWGGGRTKRFRCVSYIFDFEARLKAVYPPEQIARNKDDLIRGFDLVRIRAAGTVGWLVGWFGVQV